MADIFLSANTRAVLKNKFVVFIGSSVVRTMYKDFVVLLQENKYMTDADMRKKGELSYKGDKLLAGGQFGKMHNGVNYQEVREYKTDKHWVKFYFITRVFGNYMKEVLQELKAEPKPDVIIFNSGIWDVNRYGANGPEEFQKRLPALLEALKKQTDEDTLVLFCTSLPVSQDCKGGFLTPETEFMKESLSLQIMAANSAFRQLVPPAGFDVLDLHFLLRYHVHRRCEDGIHWDMTAHRLISNLLLTHLSEAWGLDLPGNSSKASEAEHKILSQEEVESRPGLIIQHKGGFRPKTGLKPKKKVAPVLQQFPPQDFDSANPYHLEFSGGPVQQILQDSWGENSLPRPVSSKGPKAKGSKLYSSNGTQTPAEELEWQPSLQQAPVMARKTQRGRGHTGVGAKRKCAVYAPDCSFYSGYCQSAIHGWMGHQPLPEEDFHSAWMQRYDANLHGEYYEPRSFHRYQPY